VSVSIEEVPVLDKDSAWPVELDDAEAERRFSSALFRRPSECAINRNVVFSKRTASTAPQALVRVVKPFLSAPALGMSV
jgi:hypothetical protein